MNGLQYLRIYFLAIYFQFPLNLIAEETAAIKHFLNKTQIQVKPFSLQTARNDQLAASNLEQFRDLYALSKYLLTNQYYRDYKANYKYIDSSGKVQQQIRADKPFPCALNNSRSQESPNSVHKLRPGDIDIIGAMGDSLTAGTAMMSKTFLQLVVEFRGQTSLGGGLKDWRTFLTLPNILKVFNPNLYGYAVANTLGKFREARFNVAEPFAITQDMPYMAEVLVKRMQNDPNVNMDQHWKMISILIGANDICNSMCYYDKIDDFLENHRKNLYRTLTILRNNIKRLMVNVVLVPDVHNVLRGMRNMPAHCNAFHKISCSCLIGNSISANELKARHKAIKSLQQIDIEVASLPEFQLEEFAVVPRSVANNGTLAILKNGGTDLKYLAVDCFHFSQYGNAAFTTMLWNQILQVKTKPTKLFLKPFEKFTCPTAENPYISTLQNS